MRNVFVVFRSVLSCSLSTSYCDIQAEWLFCVGVLFRSVITFLDLSRGPLERQPSNSSMDTLAHRHCDDCGKYRRSWHFVMPV